MTIKIAYLNTYDKPELGGGEEHLLLLVRDGVRRGHNISIIVQAGSALEIEARKTGVKVIALDLRPRNALRAIKEIRLAAGLERIQILHTHGFYANQIGRLAARKANKTSSGPAFKVPIVISTNHCQPDAQMAGLSSPSQTYFKNRVNQFVRDRIDNYTSKAATRIIAVSDDIRERLAEQGIDRTKIEVIHNGIDVGSDLNSAPITLAIDRGTARDAARDALGISRSGKVVGTIARLEKVKSIDTLIRALQSSGLADTTVVIVGSGSQKEDLKSLAKKLGVFERIRFIDYMKDFKTALVAFDVFAMTSLSEGLSLLMLWAQALGTPMIATRVGGNTEIIEDNVNGCLYSAGDDKELAKKLANLLEDDGLRARLAREGVRNFEENFTAEKMVEKTFNLYEKLLADHQKRL